MTQPTIPAATQTVSEDERTPNEVLRQYERLFTIRNRLISEGVLDGNAKMQDVIPTLRTVVPADIF